MFAKNPVKRWRGKARHAPHGPWPRWQSRRRGLAEIVPPPPPRSFHCGNQRRCGTEGRSHGRVCVCGKGFCFGCEPQFDGGHVDRTTRTAVVVHTVQNCLPEPSHAAPSDVSKSGRGQKTQTRSEVFPPCLLPTPRGHTMACDTEAFAEREREGGCFSTSFARGATHQPQNTTAGDRFEKGGQIRHQHESEREGRRSERERERRAHVREQKKTGARGETRPRRLHILVSQHRPPGDIDNAAVCLAMLVLVRKMMGQAFEPAVGLPPGDGLSRGDSEREKGTANHSAGRLLAGVAADGSGARKVALPKTI